MTNKIFEKYKHGIPLLIYMVVYLTWFAFLEKGLTNPDPYRLIHMKIDNYIPFLEVFVIPYFLWFGYVAVVLLYLFFRDKAGYFRCCIFLFTGMTVFLIISTLWPNGHNLRPYLMPAENLLTRWVGFLYHIDTPTNLWPSIHVFNSIGAHIGVSHCPELRNRKGLYLGSLILCISIILSTMFLKQHSVFDVITAFIMAAILYPLCYQEERLAGTRFNRWLSSIRDN